MGTVQAVGALASVLAGIFLTTWGGIKRPARIIILGWLLSSLFGMTLFGIGQVLIIWLIAIIIDSMFDPIVNVSMDAFLQTKVPPDLQGRVFSASDFIAQAMIPFTPLLAGYFGDRISNQPCVQEDSLLGRLAVGRDRSRFRVWFVDPAVWSWRDAGGTHRLFDPLHSQY